jgi:hypothetical protein
VLQALHTSDYVVPVVKQSLPMQRERKLRIRVSPETAA